MTQPTTQPALMSRDQQNQALTLLLQWIEFDPNDCDAGVGPAPASTDFLEQFQSELRWIAAP